MQQRNDLPLSGVRRTSAEYPSTQELVAAGYTLDGVNQFACEVEELAANLAARLDATQTELHGVRTVMTEPDILANYVLDFFGPSGPYPIQQREPQQQPQPQFMQQQYPGEVIDPRIMPDGAGLDSTTARPIPPIGIQRPTFPGTPQQYGGGAPNPAILGQVLAQSPQDAWKFVDNLEQQGAFQGLVLAIDS